MSGAQRLDASVPNPIPERLPLLPLRDVVIFPHMTLPLFVGRPASVAAIEWAESRDRLLFATAQKRPDVSEPQQADVHAVGTLVRVLQIFRLPDGTMRVLVEGVARVRLQSLDADAGFAFATIEAMSEKCESDRALTSRVHRVQAQFAEFAELSGRVPDEVRMSVLELEDPVQTAYLIASQILIRVSARQELLESEDVAIRLEVLRRALSKENAQLRRRTMEVVRESQAKKPQPSPSAPESDGDRDGMAEIEELDREIRRVHMPPAVETKALLELDRLARMPVFSPEATVTRSYISWLTTVPWKKKTRDRRNLDQAQKILDADHYGLAKVKERMLEHLAVVQLTRQVRGPILCLVGPPGVGKTSLGRSVAKALGRKFARIALGGVRDEAEIRGHRRTYIGSMPGRILQAMKKVGTVNPVILLDEIDKLGADYRGDPSAALLEVLDPEQNRAFNDHYLEVDYDLSQVLFITTANEASGIPQPLLDRMEFIRLPGYLESEKREIAKRFLLPKQVEAAGLANRDVRLDDEAILGLVRGYTREAGVRSLERELASVCRKMARRKAGGDLAKSGVSVGVSNLPELLGPPRFTDEVLERAGRLGVATGLAWTEAGGEVLLVEVRALPGKGDLLLTGKLGETMQESARAAVSFVRSESADLGIEPDFFAKFDLHVHVPQGAVPKDGPSAGAAIALALISALTERSTRSTVALTGEITLRGKILPVGGITEKAVAAHRTGVRTLLVPEGNRRHISEIPEEIRNELEIVPVERMDQVLKAGLTRARRSPRKRRSGRLYAA